MSRCAIPRVPELADQQQALVDHVVVDVGVTQLDRAGEELGDDHVLALGSDLHDSVRLGRGDPRIPQQPQGVVLVLDEPPYRLERMLVLQRAVEDHPPHLVPAIGADVALRVQLREQVPLRTALDPQPERRRAGRRFQADGLDLEHGQPELVMHGQPDRVAAPAADVDVGGPAPPVHDGKDLVRGEVTERRDRYRHAERDAEQHVVGVIDGQVQPGQAEHGDCHGRRCLGVGARPARYDQAVHRSDEEKRDPGDRNGRCRVSAPAAEDEHAVGARPGQAVVDHLPREDLQEEQAAQEDRQVPPAPEDHDQHHDRTPEHGDPPAGAGRVDPVGDVGQPRRAHIGQPEQHPGVGLITHPEPGRDPGEQEGEGHDDDREQDPGRGIDGDGMRQRRWCTGRAAPQACFVDVSTLGRGGRCRRGPGSRRRRGALCALAHDIRGLSRQMRPSPPPRCARIMPCRRGGVFPSWTAAACPARLRCLGPVNARSGVPGSARLQPSAAPPRR